jgi:hypothetical protein
MLELEIELIPALASTMSTATGGGSTIEKMTI